MKADERSVISIVNATSVGGPKHANGPPVVSATTAAGLHEILSASAPSVDMDTGNPVVDLCIQGMEAETQSRPADARALFTRAWELCRDDYDACVVAHCVARHQSTPEDTLHWNQEALARALLTGYHRVLYLLPSLYLSLAHSYDAVGDWSAAEHYYESAAEHLDRMNGDRYGNIVRRRGHQKKAG